LKILKYIFWQISLKKQHKKDPLSSLYLQVIKITEEVGPYTWQLGKKIIWTALQQESLL